MNLKKCYFGVILLVVVIPSFSSAKKLDVSMPGRIGIGGFYEIKKDPWWGLSEVEKDIGLSFRVWFISKIGIDMFYSAAEKEDEYNSTDNYGNPIKKIDKYEYHQISGQIMYKLWKERNFYAAFLIGSSKYKRDTWWWKEEEKGRCWAAKLGIEHLFKKEKIGLFAETGWKSEKINEKEEGKNETSDRERGVLIQVGLHYYF